MYIRRRQKKTKKQTWSDKRIGEKLTVTNKAPLALRLRYLNIDKRSTNAIVLYL